MLKVDMLSNRVKRDGFIFKAKAKVSFKVRVIDI